MRHPVAIVAFLAILAACAGGGDNVDFLVEGHGMSPTIEHGTRVAVVEYDRREPKRADIVVFRSPLAPDRDFVKRIIGLPGEALRIDNSTGTVTVNDETLSEPYVQGPTGCAQMCAWALPRPGTAQAQEECGSERCYFVLGDNRPNSSDSRQGWLVPAENIRGFVEVH